MVILASWFPVNHTCDSLLPFLEISQSTSAHCALRDGSNHKEIEAPPQKMGFFVPSEAPHTELARTGSVILNS